MPTKRNLNSHAVVLSADVETEINPDNHLVEGIANLTAETLNLKIGVGEGVIPLPAGAFYEFYRPVKNLIRAHSLSGGNITVLK